MPRYLTHVHAFDSRLYFPHPRCTRLRFNMPILIELSGKGKIQENKNR